MKSCICVVKTVKSVLDIHFRGGLWMNTRRKALCPHFLGGLERKVLFVC